MDQLTLEGGRVRGGVKSAPSSDSQPSSPSSSPTSPTHKWLESWLFIDENKTFQRNEIEWKITESCQSVIQVHSGKGRMNTVQLENSYWNKMKSFHA